MKRVFIILAICLLASCSMTKTFPVTPNDEFTKAYVGKNVSEIVSEYGDPNFVKSDGPRGMILSYEEEITEFIATNASENMEDDMANDSGFDYSQDDARPTGNIIVYKHFYIDKDDICYKVDTNDYLKGGQYRKYFNRVTITELSLLGLLIALVNIFA